jgi:hypothetical protein
MIRYLISVFLIFFSSLVNAQLRQYQDDNFAGGIGDGGLILGIIIVLVLIFGGSGARRAVLSICGLFALPGAIGWLGNNMFGLIGALLGFFLGLFIWYNLMKLTD